MSLIEAYRIIERGRRYISGMGGVVPLPLALAEIEPYLRHFTPAIPSQDFILCVFELDAVDNGWQ